MQLAALALPAHPATLSLVPAASAMEQQEAGPSAGGVAVTGVEPVDCRDGRREQLVVAGDALGRRVEPVGQEREPEVALGIAEVVDLEAGNLFLDVRLAGQERRDHDKRPQVGRHSAGQLEPRKHPGAEEGGQDPVDERERQVGGGREGEDREDQQGRSGRAAASRQHERHCEDRGRHERQRADVGEDAGGGHRPAAVGPDSGIRTFSERSRAGRPPAIR